VLLTAPEFRQAPVKSDKISLERVAPLLQHCDACHTAVQNGLPAFASGKIDRQIFAKMKWRLNLPESSDERMPLDWRNWNAADLDLVKAWVNQGASSK
jgi:hypothetical protein